MDESANGVAPPPGNAAPVGWGRYGLLANVELRQLRYFIAVAEELHFRRAAERLYVTQPALSRQIAQLEREIGVRLFDRNRRRVELTLAGSALLDSLREALVQLERSVTNARWAEQRGQRALHAACDSTAPYIRSWSSSAGRRANDVQLAAG